MVSVDIESIAVNVSAWAGLAVEVLSFLVVLEWEIVILFSASSTAILVPAVMVFLVPDNLWSAERDLCGDE